MTDGQNTKDGEMTSTPKSEIHRRRCENQGGNVPACRLTEVGQWARAGHMDGDA